jgi:hypothetical protein
VVKRLHITPPTSRKLSTRNLHQQPPADSSQRSSASSLLTSATRANTIQPERATSRHSSPSARHVLSSSRPTAGQDVIHSVPKRYLTKGNQLVGGVFLHLTRKMSSVSCSRTFSQKLSRACYYEKVTGNPKAGVCSCTRCRSMVQRCHAKPLNRFKATLHDRYMGSCMQRALELMEWTLLSIRTVHYTNQTHSSADGNSSTPLRALQSFPLLELRLHSSHEARVATKMDFQCSSRCLSSQLLCL